MKKNHEFRQTEVKGNEPQCWLKKTNGEVRSVKTFCERHLELLSKIEQSIVCEYLDSLTVSQHLFNDPVVLQYGQALEKDGIKARPSGARSALIDSLNLKIKGCAPENGKFPDWILNNDYTITVNELPYGVLTKESVMREILGFCFMKKHGFPYANTPVEVFAYRMNGQNEVYALVSSIHNTDNRLEQYLDYGEYTLYDLIRLEKSNKLKRSEIPLKCIDKSLYLKRKGDLLASINFKGGFRGILNSNIGNDVIQKDYFFGICDFDSFKLIVPEEDNQTSIKDFVVQSFLELIKTSLPFIDYLDLNNRTLEAAHHELVSYYKLNSGLFQVYFNKFLDLAGLKNWSIESVKSFIDDALLSKAGHVLLNSIIPNSYAAANFDAETLKYIPHNLN